MNYQEIRENNQEIINIKNTKKEVPDNPFNFKWDFWSTKQSEKEETKYVYRSVVEPQEAEEFWDWQTQQ